MKHTLECLVLALFIGGAMPATAQMKDDPAVVEASKSEQGVLVYTNLEPIYWEPVLKLFSEEYPWIKVETTNMGGDLWEKYYAESSTNTRTADLIVTGGVDRWLEFIDKGEVVPYVSPHTAELPEWSRPFPGLYSASADPMIIIYNKFVVPAEKAPKTVADVAALAPQFKGKISTYDAAANPFGLSLFWAWQRDRPDQWSLMEKIGPSTRPERSTGTIADKVLSGEYGIGLFLSGLGIPRLSRPDAEKLVGWSFPADGTPIVPRGLALTKAAASPNSAKLLLDTLLSRKGQIALAQNGVTAYREDITKDDVPFFSYDSIVEQVGKENILIVGYDRDLVINRDAFTARWKAAFTQQ